MLRFLLYVVPIALMVYALVDLFVSDRQSIRRLPRWGWALVIVFVVVIGPIIWMIFGTGRHSEGLGRPTGRPAPGPVGPDDDADFLRDLEWKKRRDQARRKPSDDGDSPQ